MANNSTTAEWHTVFHQRPFGWEFTERTLKGLDHYKFEEIDQFYWKNIMESNFNWATYACVAYIITIFTLQRWMRDRTAYELKGPLIIWNAAIGIFSTMGFLRTAPGLIRVLIHGGFYQSICEKKGGDAQLPLWALLFVYSKFLELGDTLFIVLRKKPLIFLQWYHHTATLFAGWAMGPFVEPFTRYLFVLNYGVHSVMYPYFSLRTMGIKLPVFIPNFITTIQFAQMVICTSVNLISMYYYLMGAQCVRYPLSVQICSTVALSFVFLFGKLFIDSVIKKGRAKRDREERRRKLE